MLLSFACTLFEPAILKEYACDNSFVGTASTWKPVSWTLTKLDCQAKHLLFDMRPTAKKVPAHLHALEFLEISHLLEIFPQCFSVRHWIDSESIHDNLFILDFLHLDSRLILCQNRSQWPRRSLLQFHFLCIIGHRFLRKLFRRRTTCQLNIGIRL